MLPRPVRSLRELFLRTSQKAKRREEGLLIEDPRMASYLNPAKEYGLISVPAENGLSFCAFTIGPGSYHPWYLAAREMARERDDRGRLILQKYYELVRPATLIDWHDIPAEDGSGLASLPRHAWSVMPWVARGIDESLLKVESAHIAENRLYGLDAGIEAGAKAFGPMADNKLSVEMQRLSTLTRSIIASGFKPRADDNDLGGRFLVANDRWRWLPTAGMHRIPVAAALGVREFTVRVVSVIRREEVSIWPNVRSGLFSERAALALFDRLLDGRPPACAAAWIEWVGGQDWYDA